jgi:hypothetical protein
MRTLFALVTLVAIGLPAHAQLTIPGTITSIRTGWDAESFAIVINAPQQNPAHCTSGNQPGAGYVTNSDLPGYHTYYAIALSAYVAGKPVSITVHNTECVGGTWPKLIGISMP